MGLLKEFRPVASTQGRRKICKSRGVLSRKICFYSGNINIERSGAGKRGVELGHLPIGPPVTHFFFLPSFFFSLCLGDFAVASKSPLLNWTFCKSSPMGVWCRLVMADAKVCKSTQKFSICRNCFPNKCSELYLLLQPTIQCVSILTPKSTFQIKTLQFFHINIIQLSSADATMYSNFVCIFYA